MRDKNTFISSSKFIITIFTVGLVLIIVFLIRWQFVEFEKYKKQASERYQEKSFSSIRGDIIAKNGETLAYSEPRWDIYAYLIDMEEAETPTSTRQSIQSRQEFVTKVSNVIGVSEDEITIKLSSGPDWIKLASKIDYKTKEKLDALKTNRDPEKKLVGLNYEFTSQRIYPEGELAAHVLGFLGKDLSGNDIGRGGLEQQYNGALEPQEGFIAGETDSKGNLINLSESVSIRARRGSTIKTTIDKNIQQIVEKILKEGVEKYQAKSGSVIVMNPMTGEIVAMATYPTYDPNKYFEQKDSSVYTNRSISIPYEVGSVAKIFTLSAAVEELGVKGDEVISEGHSGCRMIQASNIDQNDVKEICTADKKPQGPLTATEALILSDNLAFVNLADRLGKEKLYQYLVDFGVGRPTGVDITGESYGQLPSIEDKSAWHPVDLAVFSYGQSYQINLLQITRGAAVVANNGWLMQPYVVSEIINADNTSKKFEPIPLQKIISDQTAGEVKLMMEELYRRHAQEGYDHLFNYNIAAKSGTALIPYKDKIGYSKDVNATYIGFDASNDSKFVMAVWLESPQGVEKLSFFSARPLWFDIFNQIRDYVGVTSEV